MDSNQLDLLRVVPIQSQLAGNLGIRQVQPHEV